jgi:hypothetical protein
MFPVGRGEVLHCFSSFYFLFLFEGITHLKCHFESSQGICGVSLSTVDGVCLLDGQRALYILENLSFHFSSSI